MKVDPFAPQLLIDYTYFCDRFGPLPFGDFVAMWPAADALMEAATSAGFEPHEVADLLITADNPRMAFIRATVACIGPNIGRMVPRGERVRRLRVMPRRRNGKRSQHSRKWLPEGCETCRPGWTNQRRRPCRLAGRVDCYPTIR